MNAQEFKNLIEKYNQGICTREESDLLFKKIDSLKKKDIISEGEQEIRVKGIKNKLDRRISPSKIKVISLLNKWTSVAALLFVGLISYFIINPPKFLNQIKANQEQIIFSTKTGQLKLIKLDDGSKVWLNASSTIVLAEDFNQKDRELFLIGEAFFEVKKDKSKPFIVNSGNLKTQVLGTSFNIQAYKASKNIDVSLKTGKIWLKAKENKSVVLIPGQKVSYAKATNHIGKVVSTNNSSIDNWKNGNNVFENTDFSEVIQRVERAYNIKIKIENNKLFSKKIYGEFNTTKQNYLMVLDNLCHLVGANYKVKDNSIIIF